MSRWFFRGALLLLCVGAAGWLIPEPRMIPVQGAGEYSWNPDTFWYEPWGTSVTHKGIDIFAPKGTPVVAATHGLVLFVGALGKGGKVVVTLGPKWRLHYYAHLQLQTAKPLTMIPAGQSLGTVGTTGNAAGKPAHLHYGLLSLLPLPWCKTNQTQGWLRMFYLDPGAYILNRGTWHGFNC